MFFNLEQVIIGVSAVIQPAPSVSLTKIWNLWMSESQNNHIYTEYPTAFKLLWVSKKECKLFVEFCIYLVLLLGACCLVSCRFLLYFFLFWLQPAFTVIWLFPNRSDSYSTQLIGPLLEPQPSFASFLPSEANFICFYVLWAGTTFQ